MQTPSKALRLQLLREQIGAIDGSQARPRSNFSMLPCGFPRGGIVEIKGYGKTELALRFLKEHPEFKVAWIEKEISLNPFSILQRDLFKLENILFIETGKDYLWALQQVMTSQCFQVVLVSGVDFTFRELRRFQMLNERCQGHFVILTQEFHPGWVAQLQIETQKVQDGFIKVILQRSRGTL